MGDSFAERLRKQRKENHLTQPTWRQNWCIQSRRGHVGKGTVCLILAGSYG